MTIPGQVSSGSIAHQSRPITRTGRTRKGRLKSLRLASKDVRFRSAFFIARTVPLFTSTTATLFTFPPSFQMKSGKVNTVLTHTIPHNIQDLLVLKSRSVHCGIVCSLLLHTCQGYSQFTR